MQWFPATLVLLTGGLLLTGSATAGPAAPRGMALANACAACHGPDGRSQGAIPSIDTLSAEDFVAALKAFRSDTRQGTVMNRLTKGLDDGEIEAAAAYYAGRRAP